MEGFVLKILSGQQAGVEILLAAGEYSLGSSEEDDLQFHDLSLHARHAFLRVTDSAVEIRSERGNVSSGNGLELAAGHPEWRQVEPLDIITIGMTRFAVGAPTANWASIADGSKPEQEDRGMEAPAAARARLGLFSQIQNFRVLLFAGVFIFLTALGGAAWMLSRGETVERVLIKSDPKADFATVQDAVAQLAFKHSVKVTQEVDNSIYVTGYVQTLVERRAMVNAVEATGIQVSMRVGVIEVLKNGVASLLESAGFDLGFDISEDGVLTIRGTLLDAAAMDRLQRLINGQMEGLSKVEWDIRSAEDLLAEVQELARRARIDDTVILRLDGALVEASGLIGPEKIDLWAGFVVSYMRNFADVIPLRSYVQIASKEESAPPRIAAPADESGNALGVETNDGSRIYGKEELLARDSHGVWHDAGADAAGISEALAPDRLLPDRPAPAEQPGQPAQTPYRLPPHAAISAEALHAPVVESSPARSILLPQPGMPLPVARLLMQESRMPMAAPPPRVRPGAPRRQSAAARVEEGASTLPRRPIDPPGDHSGKGEGADVSPWFADLIATGGRGTIPAESKVSRPPVPSEILRASPSMERIYVQEPIRLAVPVAVEEQEDPLVLPLIGPLAFDPGQGLVPLPDVFPESTSQAVSSAYEPARMELPESAVPARLMPSPPQPAPSLIGDREIAKVLGTLAPLESAAACPSGREGTKLSPIAVTPSELEALDLPALTRRLLRAWRGGKLKGADMPPGISELSSALELISRVRIEGAAMQGTELQDPFSGVGSCPQAQDQCWPGSKLDRGNLPAVMVWLDLLSIAEGTSLSQFQPHNQALILEAGLNPKRVAQCAIGSVARTDIGLSIYIADSIANPGIINAVAGRLDRFAINISGASLIGERFVQTVEGEKLREGAAPTADSRLLHIGELGTYFRTPRGLAVTIYDPRMSWFYDG